MKTITSILMLTALVACGQRQPPLGTPIQQTSTTAKTIVVPVRNTQLRIQYDPAAEPTIATLTYVAQPAMTDLLFINRDVIPALRRATGCSVAAPAVADNRLLPSEGRTRVPLNC